MSSLSTQKQKWMSDLIFFSILKLNKESQIDLLVGHLLLFNSFISKSIHIYGNIYIYLLNALIGKRRLEHD